MSLKNSVDTRQGLSSQTGPCRVGQVLWLTFDTLSRGVGYCAHNNLAFEGAEDDQTEFRC